MTSESSKGLLGKLKRKIFPPAKITLAERYPQFKIGRWSYGDLSVFSWDESVQLVVGNFTSIAPGVKIFLGGEHRVDWVTTFPFNVLWESASQHKGHPRTKGDVSIGNDVWIGTEAVIFSGVTVGDGAVVGARAVVTRDVEPYAIVAGNPARFVKSRFSSEVIAKLVQLKWWNWQEAEIERAMPEMLNGDIERFLEKAQSGAYRD